MGERLDADFRYGQGDQLSPEQLATAELLLGESELALSEKGAGEGAVVEQAALSPAEQAKSERADKNAKMMAELIKQKLNAMLDGKPDEEARIAGMMKVLEERMNG